MEAIGEILPIHVLFHIGRVKFRISWTVPWVFEWHVIENRIVKFSSKVRIDIFYINKYILFSIKFQASIITDFNNYLLDREEARLSISKKADFSVMKTVIPKRSFILLSMSLLNCSHFFLRTATGMDSDSLIDETFLWA